MADIFNWYGEDVSFNVSADLQTVEGSTYTKQRIVKRLLTLPKSYLWDPDYGAGLGQYVGKNLDATLTQTLQGIIISQILREEAVAQNPKPIVQVSRINAQGVTGLQIDITYYDLQQQVQYLSFQATP